MQDFASFGDRAAVIDEASGRRLTYADLAVGARRVAAYLIGIGLKKGDRFAICLPNTPEYAIALLGVTAAGGVVTTLNPLMTSQEIHRQLRDTAARWVLTVASLAGSCCEAIEGTAVELVFCIGDARGTVPFAALLVEERPSPKIHIDAHHDLVALPYSSGTSGFPKGVMLTHRNVVAQLCQSSTVVPANLQGRVAGVVPFSHILGLVLTLLFWLRRGGTIVALARFDLARFLGCVQRYRLNYASLVPPIIVALAKHPLVDEYDLSSLDWIRCGAAPLGGEVEQACAARLGCRIGQGWGMTEIAGAGSSARMTDTAPIRRGSCGQLWPGMEARILDLGTSADLDAEKTGELVVRGPTVMQGYLDQPEATAQMRLPEGWIRTGDIAYFDQEGYLYIVDRAKELIKYNAYPIAPAELEAILVSHPAVAEAVVIPSLDNEHGEVPKAFVVLRGKATPEELMAFVAGRVAPYKRVRKLAIIDAIPKSSAGKLLRRVLVEKDRLGNGSLPEI
jgi:acyl-CoA synthetase (AMP-forming)/AMP-acid ligase II